MANEGSADIILAIPDLSDGIGFNWSPIGNKLVLFSKSHKTKVNVQLPAFVHEVVWENSMFGDIARRLVSESSNTFQSLQTELSSTDVVTIRRLKLLRASREYRAVIQSKIAELLEAEEKTIDEEEKQQFIIQKDSLYRVELAWNLCEILYFDIQPAGVILTRLLDWIRQHFHKCQNDAADLIQQQNWDYGDSYWNTIYGFVLQGRIQEARKFLQRIPMFSSPPFQNMDRILKTMPKFSLDSGKSVAEFDIIWAQWRDSCKLSLQNSEFGNNVRLGKLARILTGEKTVYFECRELCESWYHMLVSKLLYTFPTVGIFDLHDYTQEAISMYYKSLTELNELDRMLVSIFEFDIFGIMKEGCHLFESNWFIAHLTDLFYHSNHLDGDQINGDALREFFLSDYAASLMMDESLWEVGFIYLDHCPTIGRNHQEVYLERISIDSEQQALSVVEMANQKGFFEIAASVCRTMSMRMVKHKRYGAALSWALRFKDVSLTTFLTDKILFQYSKFGRQSGLAMIEHIGSEVSVSGRLTFASQYCEFRKMFENKMFQEAASMLLQLIRAQLAPKFFQLRLLLDALELIREDRSVFSSDDVYDLMYHMEDLMSQNTKDSEVKLETVDDELQEIRISLLQNLAGVDM